MILNFFKKAFISLVLCTLIFAFDSNGAWAKANPKYASIVVDGNTGQVISERYADKKLYPASLTKMMTLYMVFDAIKKGDWTLDTRLYVSKKAEQQVPSKLGVKRGQRISVEDAIKALVVKSANDVAVVVAENHSGSEYRFAQAMTQKAKDIGMSRTVFKNASGLPNSKQISTARDMAVLGMALIHDHSEFYHYFDDKSFEYKGKTYRGHNKLLSTYRGMDGLKTGYIRASGFNLVSSARRGGKHLVGVVFGGRTSNSRNRHMASLLDRGFRIAKSGTYLASAKIGTPPSPKQKPVMATQIAALDTTMDIGADDIYDVSIELAEQGSGDIPSPLGFLERAREKAAQNANVINVASQIFYYDEKQDKMVTAVMNGMNHPKLYGLDVGEWSIQVGAFNSRVKSESAIQNARSRLPKILEKMPAVNVPVKDRGGKYLFRARLTGLDKQEAYAACSVLDDCMVIAPKS
tara:strand:- start:231 stop:1622 length:1392 start_codon:yes stop_codon:yes gene_type:complete